MRRTPTAEQRQQAEARRARFRELAKQVGALSEDERTAIMLRAGGIRTIEGHPLTPLNSCLILNQCPGASIVGGFQQWKAAGRAVRKGEKGLSLWVPIGRRRDDGTRGEVGDGEKPGFIMGTVFDVSQTDHSES